MLLFVLFSTFSLQDAHSRQTPCCMTMVKNILGEHIAQEKNGVIQEDELGHHCGK